MPSLEDIVGSIDRRLAEAERELASLQAARDALVAEPRSGARRGSAPGRARRRRPTASGSGDAVAVTPRRTARPAAGRQRAAGQRATERRRPEPETGRPATTAASKRTRRRSAPLEPARIEALLGTSPSGLSLAALAKELGVAAARIQPILKDFEQTGRVRSEGSRRTSRWRLITDEERIADRVAELERGQAPRSETT